jgi:hypothetical protein
MRTMLVLVLAAALGCSHEAKPTVAPDDHPPLPPASGTPIGYLIDDASELSLGDDQLTQLKTIDSELADKLAVLDGGQRGSKPAGDATGTQSRRRGGRRGGMGGGGAGGGGAGMGGAGGGGMGGAGGGMGGRGGRGRRSAQGAGAGSGSASGGGNAAAGAVNERAAEVHDALKRAFALLDPHQKEIAARVLSDRGVDVDTDHPGEDAEEPAAGSDGK